MSEAGALDYAQWREQSTESEGVAYVGPQLSVPARGREERADRLGLTQTNCRFFFRPAGEKRTTEDIKCHLAVQHLH